MSASPYKSGFVAVLGRPNVGKSALVNALLGQKVAAVTPRPQTTRKRQMGILTLEDPERQGQVVFIDTPGVHRPRHKLGQHMNDEALETLKEADVVLFVADSSQPPTSEDQQLFDLLAELRRPGHVLLALNKIDLLSPEALAERQQVFSANLPGALLLPISARRGDGLPALLDAILERLPAGEPFFPPDQMTDLYERDIAADLIREACLILLRDEIPHGIAIRIDQYTERGDEGAYIEATIFVEREAHKPIVIGRNGEMLKQIGSSARRAIEEMSGRKVYLQLKVKLRKNWRDDEAVLKNFGYR